MHLIGEGDRIPDDRPIDGINQADFILGKQEQSNREHVLCYIGNDLVSVKWRTFKIHLKTYESLWAPVHEYQFPPVYDVANDPGEANNLMTFNLFSHSWVYGPMRTILAEKARSITQYPNIKPGGKTATGDVLARVFEFLRAGTRDSGASPETSSPARPE